MQFRVTTSWLAGRKCAQAISDTNIKTALEYLGLVPGLCKLGDHVVLLQGVRLPLVLRLKSECLLHVGEGKSKTVRTWELIGDGYVHGIMKGECWDEKRCEDVWIA